MKVPEKSPAPSGPVLFHTGPRNSKGRTACQERSKRARQEVKILREDKILQTDKSVRKYTGMMTNKNLHGTYSIINEKKGYGGRARILTMFEEYLLTLVHIRSGFDHQILADLFVCSQQQLVPS